MGGLPSLPYHQLTQGENDLINRTNFECSPGGPVPGYLKCFTQALRASTLREKGERETPHNEGTGTKPKKTYTIPFPGSNCRSSLYRWTATIAAAADVRVQKRDNITRNDDDRTVSERPNREVSSPMSGRVLVRTKQTWDKSSNQHKGTK